MRPLRLQLKGFTSFKEETVVDFAQLDRFVVCGPTGAGKSSLFDAMTFALFSDAPRIDTGNKTDLVSLGKKSFFVALDFRVGSASYRVLRTRTRTGAADQPDQLHRLGAGPTEHELIASGAKAVTTAVEKVLGLTYVHFTQAVFLPQGKFAEFLRARASERRKLLNELLRLLVYEKMRETAGKEGKSHATHRDQTDRRLREDFEGVTQESRDEIARQRAIFEQAMAEADRQLPELKLRLEETRCNYEWTAELEAKRLERTQLEAKKPVIDALLAEVEAGNRAAGVVPLLDLADSARQAAERRDESLAQANRLREQRRSAHITAKSQFDRAKKEAINLPEMRERIQRLAQAEGKLAVCQQLRRQIVANEERARTIVTERGQCAEKLAQLMAAITVVEETLRQAQTDLDAIDYDEDHHRRLSASIETAFRLRTQREGLTEMLRQAEQFESRAVQAQSNVDHAAATEKAALKTQTQVQRQFDKAEHTMRSVEEEHRAAHLRAGLKAGEPCPVCHRTVSKLPREEPMPELDASRQTLTEAEAALAKAKNCTAQQSDALARFRVIAQTVQQQADTARAEATQRQQAILLQEEMLASAILVASGGRKASEKVAVARRGANAPRSPIEDEIIADLRAATALSDRHRLARQTVNDLANELSHKQKDATFLRTENGRLEKDLSATSANIAQDKKSLTQVEEEVRAAAGTNDPVAESAKIQQEIEQIEDRLTETTRLEGEANRLRLLAESSVENCTKEAATATERARQLERQSHEALSQARFADALAARDAFRAPQHLQQIKAQIDDHAVAMRGLQTRIDELEESLHGKSVTREEFRQAEQAVNDCAVRRNEAENQGIVLSGQLKSMDERLEKSRQLRDELTVHERQQFIFEQLAKDLRSDYFQAYLLEETLAGLVRDASAQLMRLTGERYGLFFEEERIFVIDHDNAAERRGIETLSGGETFLASLALALALSEQVQKIAGAVHLDCLFIDEGFGALDPETLRTVSDTIRALQVGGRMVGVITHVPEIKDEFDQRLLVEKKEGLSRVVVEIA